MLSFLCAVIFDEIAPIFGFFVFFFVFVAIIIGNAVKKNQSNNTTQNYDEPFDDANNRGFLTEQQRRYQNNLKQQKAQRQSQKSAHGGASDDDHKHTGTVERYESIVGSLGEVSDEGCDELDGVRLIATDLFYEEGEERQYDYQAIGKSLVLGEIFNTPRFKKPHGKK